MPGLRTPTKTKRAKAAADSVSLLQNSFNRTRALTITTSVKTSYSREKLLMKCAGQMKEEQYSFQDSSRLPSPNACSESVEPQLGCCCDLILIRFLFTMTYLHHDCSRTPSKSPSEDESIPPSQHEMDKLIYPCTIYSNPRFPIKVSIR